MRALIMAAFGGGLAVAMLPANSAFSQAPAAPAPEAQQVPAQPLPPPATPLPDAPSGAAPQTGSAQPSAGPVVPPLPADEVVQAAGFGDQVTLTGRPAILLPGKTTWDDLYGTFRKAIAELLQIAARNGLKASGPPMIRFVSSSDDQVDYEAILPVEQVPADVERLAPARPGETPAGQAIRFVHHGGYDTMEQTYDEITNHLDERGITAEDAFVEEYVRDPDKTPETEMATFIYVFPKK
jgi:effector-binding domain-containing protein